MNEKPKFMCYRSFKLNDFIGFHFYRSFKLNDFVGFHFYHSFVHVSFVRSCFVHLVNNFDSKRRFLSWRFELRISNGNTKLWFIRVRSVAQKYSAFHRFHCILAMQNISIYFFAFDTPKKTLYPSKCRVLHIRLFTVFRFMLYFPETLHSEMQSFKTPFLPNGL